ncbi:response regulator transcription factor [bacterium]|nr:response regulator transcription factor [bacterium]
MVLRVLIADDHKLFRQGLISLMKTREDLVTIVGEAETGRESVAMAKELKPDLVLLDIYMPEGNGLEAAKAIRKEVPEAAIVLLTSSELDEHLQEAVKVGVQGYLLKDLDADELFTLLSGIEQGEAAMTRSMAARLLKNMANSADDNVGRESLTEREIEVLRNVARGESNHQIAENLHITVNTVKTHLKNILSKLQLENRTQAATYAIRTGIISSEDGAADINHPEG